MLSLFIVVSKYLNIFYISLFLFFGTLYVANERLDVYYRGNYDFRQFFIIILMNVTSGIILCFSKLNISDINTFLFFLCSTIVFITAKITLRNVYKNSCPVLWNGVFFLLNLGLIVIYRLYPYTAFRQLLFIVLGFCFIFAMPLVFKILIKVERFGIVFLVLTFALILLPFIFPNSNYGSLNWVSIPIKNYNVSFQPSEIAKIVYIFFMASLFKGEPTKIKSITSVIVSALIVLMLTIQKDLGAGLIYFMTFVILYLIVTSDYLFVVLAGVGGCIASYFSYQYFGHVQVRVDTWLNPLNYPQTGGYQVLQSWFAMGTNGLLGSGLGNGYPKYVPVVESDFIYSAIAEEFGGIFAILLIFVYVMVFYRMINISLRSEKKFYALLAVGISALLYFQTLLILGGVTGFIPLTGVTLPFISAGGSSVLVSIVMIGVIQWVYVKNKQWIEKNADNLDNDYLQYVEDSEDYFDYIEETEDEDGERDFDVE